MRSILLACVIATLACSPTAQAQDNPLIPPHELRAIAVACRDGETILHLLRKETEGERQSVDKMMFCIAKNGTRVLSIECSHQTKRCKSPVVTRETIEEFRRFLKSMGDESNLTSV